MSAPPPVDDWATDFDHLDPRWIEDPYPIWDALREQCPIAHTTRYRGVYFPSRFADVRAVAYDTEHFSSRRIMVRDTPPPRSAGAADHERSAAPPARRRTCCCRRSRRTRSSVTNRARATSAAR